MNTRGLLISKGLLCRSSKLDFYIADTCEPYLLSRTVLSVRVEYDIGESHVKLTINNNKIWLHHLVMLLDIMLQDFEVTVYQPYYDGEAAKQQYFTFKDVNYYKIDGSFIDLLICYTKSGLGELSIYIPKNSFELYELISSEILFD